MYEPLGKGSVDLTGLLDGLIPVDSQRSLGSSSKRSPLMISTVTAGPLTRKTGPLLLNLAAAVKTKGQEEMKGARTSRRETAKRLCSIKEDAAIESVCVRGERVSVKFLSSSSGLDLGMPRRASGLKFGGGVGCCLPGGCGCYCCWSSLLG